MQLSEILVVRYRQFHSTIAMTSGFETVWVDVIKYVRHPNLPHIEFLVYSRTKGRVQISVVPSADRKTPIEHKQATVGRVIEAMKDIRTMENIETKIASALETSLGVHGLTQGWEQKIVPAKISKHRDYPLEIIFTHNGAGFDAGPRITACDNPSMVRGLEACVARFVSGEPRTWRPGDGTYQYEEELDQELRNYKPLTEDEAAALGYRAKLNCMQ